MTARLVLPPVPAVAVTTGRCELIPATVEWLRETWPCATCRGSGVVSSGYELDAMDCPRCDGRGWLIPSDARLDIWTDDTPPEPGDNANAWWAIGEHEAEPCFWIHRDGHEAQRLPLPAPNSFAGRVQVTGCLPIVDAAPGMETPSGPVLVRVGERLIMDSAPNLDKGSFDSVSDVTASAAWWPDTACPDIECDNGKKIAHDYAVTRALINCRTCTGSGRVSAFAPGGWALTVQGETQ